MKRSAYLVKLAKEVYEETYSVGDELLTDTQLDTCRPTRCETVEHAGNTSENTWPLIIPLSPIETTVPESKICIVLASIPLYSSEEQIHSNLKSRDIIAPTIMDYSGEGNVSQMTSPFYEHNSETCSADCSSSPLTKEQEALLLQLDNVLPALSVIENESEDNNGMDKDDPEWFPPEKVSNDSELHIQETITTCNKRNEKDANDTTDEYISPENIALIAGYKQKDVRGKKRIRNPSSWKRTIAKYKRFKGESYESAASKCKKVVPARVMRPPCAENCRNKCSAKISHDERDNIHSKFWTDFQSWDQRRQYISSSVEVSLVKRPRARNGARLEKRLTSRKYYFTLANDKRVMVCQKMFLNTLAVSERFISVTLKKREPSGSGIVEQDKRGRHEPNNKSSNALLNSIKEHILSFPTYQSHYSRERSRRSYLGPELNISLMYKIYLEHCKDKCVSEDSIGSEWLYRKIFNEHFNLGFHPPTNDTCDTCDTAKIAIENAETPEEQCLLKQERDEHLTEATARYGTKANDKERAKLPGSKEHTLMFDMEKCLPTPSLKNCQSFYLRKLWVLNETIYDSTNDKSYCMMWHECEGGRGGNEVASCILKWALNDLPKDVEKLTLWSDNCTGQNRNIMVVYCYMWMLSKIPHLKSIDHKFLLRGHTHLEVDAVHSIIERKRNKLKDFEIAVPRDWEQFVRTCRAGKPMTVHHMSLNDFINFASLGTGTHSPFVNKKLNSEGDSFLLSKAVWLRVEASNLGKLLYKTSFQDKKFKEIDMRRKKRNELEMPNSLPVVRSKMRPLSLSKYEDLETLTKWIPGFYSQFYKDLPHSEKATDDL